MIQNTFVDFRRFSIFLNGVVILIPCLVLIGWHFDIIYLTRISLQLVAMNPATASLLLLSGISLYFINEINPGKKIRIGKYIGLAVACVATIKLAEFTNSHNFSIDLLMFKNKLGDNRMALNTSIAILFVGLSLFLTDTGNKKNVGAQIFAIMAFVISLLAIIGYLFSAGSLYRFTVYTPMSILTAVTLMLLTVGLMLCRPNRGLIGVITQNNIGGNLIRKLLPIIFLIPVLVSVLIFTGQRSNIFDYEFGAAMGVILIICIFSLIIWFIARSLNKTDEKRKKAELRLLKITTELSENEIKYRPLIENAGVVMYTTNLEGIITFCSNKAFQLTGYTTKELTGMHFSVLIERVNLNRIVDKYWHQVKNSIEETQIEFCIITKDGETKWVEQCAVLILENGHPVGFQLIIKDISESKKMEEILQKYETQLISNQERLQSILDNTTSLIYIKDLEGRYLLTNKMFKDILNVSDDDIIGKSDFDFTTPEQAHRFKAADDLVIKSGKPVEIEEIIERGDTNYNLLIIKFPLLDAQNKVYGISGIATDITERARYQKQLIEAKYMAENAKQLQEQFLANMSHEIRTPMNGILGMTSLLLETELSEEQRDFAKTIKQSSDNLIVIINDILDFSKIKAGKLTVEKIDFNLYEVLENIKAIFKQTVTEKGLTFNMSVTDEIPEIVNGDPYRLNQVLVNLVGNALKFTHKGGVDLKISISQINLGQLVLKFIISDTGIGIEEDKVSEVFESFNQGSVGTSRKYGGTGLGLAICRQLLDLQGGTISVQSKVDEGTMFEFTIPYNYSITNNPILYAGKNAKNYRVYLKGKKILVAEDNEINQKVIQQVLYKAGATVVIANNGLEAITNLKNDNHFDLIIMDLQMPVMDGYAATLYIRNVMNLSIPIMAMTASAIKDEKTRCLEIGMNDYLTKPFDISDIYKRLSLLLGNTPSHDKFTVIDRPVSTKLFDLSLLEEMDDNEYMIEILSLFLRNTSIEINAIDEAFQSGDTDAIYKISHKLKSSVGLLHANTLLQLLEKIEKMARANETNNLSIFIEDVKEEYKKIEKPLQELLTQITLTVAI